MKRSFYVGENLTEEDVQAKYEDGVLTVKLPKKEARTVPEKKQILIGSYRRIDQLTQRSGSHEPLHLFKEIPRLRSE